jgi:hypothetical protein
MTALSSVTVEVLAKVLEVPLAVTEPAVPELLVEVLPAPPLSRRYPPIPATTKATTMTTAATVVETAVLELRISLQPVTTIVPDTGTRQVSQWYE